jgi:uncharacterized integral membrane protein
MQIFLFVALSIALIAVMFALQNIVPVTVAFLAWRFEGSLALVLFFALVVGALVSLLASIPALVKGRWTATSLKKRIATLEGDLAESRRRLEAYRTKGPGSADPELEIGPPPMPPLP